MSAPAPSETLSNEATSVLPEWLTLALVLWVAGMLIVRSRVLLDKGKVDNAAHAWVAGSLAVVALRDRFVQQHLLEPLGLSLGDIRVVTHSVVLVCAALLAILGFLWHSGRLPSKRFPYALLALVVVLSLALWFISKPARDAGIAVEELESWRTGLYMTIYSLPTPIAEIPAALTALIMLRERTLPTRFLFGVLVIAAIAGSWLDHLTRLVNGWLLAFGHHNWFTAIRAESNDAFFLPIIAMLLLLAVPSVVTSVRVRRGTDPDSLAVLRLRNLWKALTDEVPDYRLLGSFRMAHPVDLHHRMRIEIEDTFGKLCRFIPYDCPWPETPAGRAALIRQALASHARGDLPLSQAQIPEWMTDEDQVDLVADAWNDPRIDDSNPLNYPPKEPETNRAAS